LAGRRSDRIPLIEPRGAKRSVLSEGAGVPIGLAHDSANRNDQPLLAPTLDSIPVKRPKPSRTHPQGLCLDRGYDSPPMDDLAVKHGYTPHIRARGEEIELKARTPGWRARRWVLEATHSWLNRNLPSSSAGLRRTRTTSPCSSSPAA